MSTLAGRLFRQAPGVADVTSTGQVLPSYDSGRPVLERDLSRYVCLLPRVTQNSGSCTLTLQQHLARADAYIARINRRIEKHKGLMSRSPNAQTVAMTRDLVAVQIAWRGNIENRCRTLRKTACPASRQS